MTPEQRITELVRAGATIATQGLTFILAHAEPVPGGLFWIAVPGGMQNVHGTPYERATLHGPGVCLHAGGELVAFVTIFEDTPEVSTDDAAEALAGFRSGVEQDEDHRAAWARFVEIERPEKIG